MQILANGGLGEGKEFDGLAVVANMKELGAV